MNADLDVSQAERGLLLGLLRQFLPEVAVWAFGSRVKGRARATSDLDLVVFAKPSQRPDVFALQEALEESALPFRVDVLVWDELPENFRENIRRQYIELAAGH